MPAVPATAQRLGISWNPATGFIEFVSATVASVPAGSAPEIIVAFSELRVDALPDEIRPECAVTVSPLSDYVSPSDDIADYVVTPAGFPALQTMTLDFLLDIELRNETSRVKLSESLTAQRAVADLAGCDLADEQLSVWVARIPIDKPLDDGTWTVYPTTHRWAGEFKTNVTKRVPAEFTVGDTDEVFADTFALGDEVDVTPGDVIAAALRPDWSLGPIDTSAEDSLAVSTTRTIDWVATRLGLRLGAAELPEVYIDGGNAGCTLRDRLISAATPGSCRVFVRITGGTGRLDLDVRALNGRSTVDRDGPNVFDLKPLYVLFSDSPDMERDTNGEIADYVQDLADFMATQLPGHSLRIDTSGGVPDVQVVNIPMTQQEFLAEFTDGLGPLERLLEEQGIVTPWRDRPLRGYEDQHRIYVGLIEGPRGAYNSPNSVTDGGCGNSTGLTVQMYYVRDLDGQPCPFIESYGSFDYRGGDQSSWPGFDAIRLMLSNLQANPGCDAVLGLDGGIPLDERPGSITPYHDVIAYGYRHDGQPDRKPELDPTHSFYFDVQSGPSQGDPCRDIIFSPYWTQAGTREQVDLPAADNTPGRATRDRPDEVTGPQVHLVYVLAADSRDQHLDTDGTLHAAFSTANEWLFANGGKRLRLDTFEGEADVTFVRLDRSQAEWWLDDAGNRCSNCPTPRTVFDAVAAAGALSPGKVNVIVSAIAPAPNSWTQPVPCAISDPRSLAAFVVVDLTPMSSRFGSCNVPAVTTVPDTTNSLGLLMLHEIFHVLGGIDPRAPNFDEFHIGGDPTDLMGGSAGTVRLDPGRDDYWDGGDGYLDLSRSTLMVPTEPDPIPPPSWPGRL
ncbi:MAG: hypothetical protein ACKOAZ_05510 [Ilumatobacteraceae bacterium]